MVTSFEKIVSKFSKLYLPYSEVISIFVEFFNFINPFTFVR